MQDKKITIIGGGHGTSVVMRALNGKGARLSAILSMADDGGSTGKLREELGASAVGDIRQCLVALSDRPEIAGLFSYRFESGSLSGHSLGNLFLVAGEKRTGSLEKSIGLAKEALGVDCDILPSTNDKSHLSLDLNGKKVNGVYTIANTDFEGSKPELSLVPEAKISNSAQSSIEQADFIIIAPGNFYCSIIPALLVKGIAEAVNQSKGKVIFIANLVNRNGHTKNFKPEDYVNEIKRLTDIIPDGIVYNTAPIPEDCLHEGEEALGADLTSLEKSIGRDIADTQKVENDAKDKISAVRSLVRHDPIKLAAAVNEIMEII